MGFELLIVGVVGGWVGWLVVGSGSGEGARCGAAD